MPIPKLPNEYYGETYFLTLTTIEWINIFTKQRYFEILFDALNYCQNEKGMQVFAYVFMTNHIHLIVSNKKEKLSENIRDYKSYTTREILKELKSDGRQYILRLIKSSFKKKSENFFQVWQKDNYPELIESEKFFLQKVEYIHNNPVKKNYVKKPEDWVYSSAGYWFCQRESGLKISGFMYD